MSRSAPSRHLRRRVGRPPPAVRRVKSPKAWSAVSATLGCGLARTSRTSVRRASPRVFAAATPRFESGHSVCGSAGSIAGAACPQPRTAAVRSVPGDRSPALEAVSHQGLEAPGPEARGCAGDVSHRRIRSPLPTRRSAQRRAEDAEQQWSGWPARSGIYTFRHPSVGGWCNWQHGGFWSR